MRSRRAFLSGMVALLPMECVCYAQAAVPMLDYEDLRTYFGEGTTVLLSCEGIAGIFQLDITDVVNEDNGGTVIVDVLSRRWKRLVTGDLDVRWWNAIGDGTDESKAAAAMIRSLNQLAVPTGFTLTCKNIKLNHDTKVVVKGTLKLPNECFDNDKILVADNVSGLDIYINNIDGNASGQVGKIGTHLIYITRSHAPRITIKYAHDHYAEPVGSVDPGPDGLRNTSSGAIFLNTVTEAKIKVELLDGWGREGIYLANSFGSVISLGHAQGRGNNEYSGLQVGGENNTIKHASVDYAGASAVGFDTKNGRIQNIIVTRTRENSGVNFGHPGNPASGSVGKNIVVLDVKGDGISVGAGTRGLTLSGIIVKDAGNFGVRISDLAQKLVILGGSISGSGRANWCASAAEILAVGVQGNQVDAFTLVVSSANRLFADGELLTGKAGSGVIRKTNRNLTGSIQILHMASKQGSFALNGMVFGEKSGASGIVKGAHKPNKYYEINGGIVSDVEDRELSKAGVKALASQKNSSDSMHK